MVSKTLDIMQWRTTTSKRKEKNDVSPMIILWLCCPKTDSSLYRMDPEKGHPGGDWMIPWLEMELKLCSEQGS